MEQLWDPAQRELPFCCQISRHVQEKLVHQRTVVKYIKDEEFADERICPGLWYSKVRTESACKVELLNLHVCFTDEVLYLSSIHASQDCIVS